MLVLSRMRDETIVLDFSAATDEQLAKLRSGEEQIEVTVVDIRGDKVRIGVEAARPVEVHRKEVWERIQLEKRTPPAK